MNSFNLMVLAISWLVTVSGAEQEPPNIQPILTPKVIREGQKIKISCSLFSGSAPIRFSWTKNGQPMDAGEDHQILSRDDVSELILHKIRLQDSGEYKCLAENSAGKDESVDRIQVKGERTKKTFG